MNYAMDVPKLFTAEYAESRGKSLSQKQKLFRRTAVILPFTLPLEVAPCQWSNDQNAPAFPPDVSVGPLWRAL
jgi:hypothetical protein